MIRLFGFDPDKAVLVAYVDPAVWIADTDPAAWFGSRSGCLG